MRTRKPEDAELLFEWILADVLDKHGVFERVLSERARCPSSGGTITEKTLVEAEGGIEIEVEI